MTRSPANALPSILPTIRVRAVLIAAVVGLVASVNLYLAARSIGLIVDGAPAVDWVQYVEATHRIGTSSLYEVSDNYAYRYSPLLVYLFAPLSLLGTIGWRLLHLAAALALPNWPMRIVALLSWPLWYDVQTGNLMVFVVLAAAWAIRGSRIGSIAFLALALLVPRPLMAPVALWILWRQADLRWPFAIGFVVHLVLVLLSGLGDAWIGTIIAASEDVALPSNIGPSRFIPVVAWIAVGVPLAGFLVARNRLGLASMAASPYWLPYYLLMLLLELRDSPSLRNAVRLRSGAR
jgi:hypothetical protein